MPPSGITIRRFEKSGDYETYMMTYTRSGITVERSFISRDGRLSHSNAIEWAKKECEKEFALV